MAAGQLLGLPVRDHIIVGDDRFTSLLETQPHLFMTSGNRLAAEP